MRYRVDELAAAAGVSVDTVRFYQARGLLPRPERDGRVAWYDQTHVERLARIRQLKGQGFPLAMIGRVLDGELDPPAQALALAIAAPAVEEGLGLADLAERTGASLPLLEALEREGLLAGGDGNERPYTAADLEAVEAGLALLGAGVPLSELLALARTHTEHMAPVADAAVDLFARYVYEPVRDADDPDAGVRLVAALQVMLPAAEALVGHTFRRRLLAAAAERLAG